MPPIPLAPPAKYAQRPLFRAVPRMFATLGLLSVGYLAGAIGLELIGPASDGPIAGALFALAIGLYGFLGLLVAVASVLDAINKWKRQAQAQDERSEAQARRSTVNPVPIVIGLIIAAIGTLAMVAIPVPVWAILATLLVLFLPALLLGLWERYRGIAPPLKR